MTHLRTLLAALCLCAVGLLPVPSFAATELVLWHAYRAEEKAALEKVVAEYNKANEGKVKVTTLAVPYDAYADKISATVPRGKGPDLFIFAQDRLGGWIEAGNTVEPIDFFLDDATKKRFIPTTMEAMTYRGTAYGLPLNYKVITLIYNKKLVPTPPKTSGEMVTMAKKLTDAKAGRFGLAYAYNDFYYHAAVMNGFGGGVFDAKNAPTMNSPANVKSVEQVLKWKNKDGILPAEPSSALITSLFNEGKAAMVFSGPWFLGEVDKSVEYGLARLPTLDENKGTPMKPWMTVEGVYVAAPSKNKEAAYDFAKFLTDAGPAKTLALEGRQSPANQSVYQDAKVAADPLLKAMKDQVDVAVPMPNLPEMSMVWTPATSAMNTVFKNTATPKAALDGAQKSVAKDVAGLRKK
ncbi:extracellular solute-binding protein [Corallococcus carmarthensis]|uniref:Extracellular solute-binding protein n=1 Tax=Corallococcus carmarthensis TaxID=2316728 RepID=A0A3A8JRD7_9BACT|nr:extracellular solute-binding protein [Corallococcus carmarthensis]NOK19096.1 extracellular solute-binding protein [Corallococcus carmarthensis]RKG98347.1 extracellular solute-binding protein [Corallococcus carmarthensis]